MRRQIEHRLLILIILCAVLAAPMASGQTMTEAVPPESMSPARDSTAPAPTRFEELDANGDNAISKDEAAVDPALAQAFDTLDKDADGKLSPAEYAAYNVAGGGKT
ncbi:hypothetical protein [Pseudoxanthomonas sp. UTMC 1351]|uniref:hypothetical protein n=1 Tax=Pseudoxanthomonas sp. UTMC 1351 TaxID=2695853 RepID=UPI0034CF2725